MTKKIEVSSQHNLATNCATVTIDTVAAAKGIAIQNHEYTYYAWKDSPIQLHNRYGHAYHNQILTPSKENLFPNNPPNNNLNTAGSNVFKKLLLAISPVFLAFGWVNLFESAKQFAKAKNQNYERSMDLGVSIISAVGATVAFILTVAAVGGFMYAAPYVVGVILGLNALRCVYYASKSLAAALSSNNKEERLQHLKATGMHLLGIVTAVLGLIANIVLFQAFQLSMAANKVIGRQPTDIGLGASMDYYRTLPFIKTLLGSVNSANSLANKGFALVIASLSLATLGALPAAWEMNKESLNLIKGIKNKEATFEEQALATIRDIINFRHHKTASQLQKALVMITAPLSITAYAIAGLTHAVVLRPVAALLLGIPQVLANLAYPHIKKYLPAKQASETSTPIPPKEPTKEERSALRTDILNKLKRIDGKLTQDNDKNAAKHQGQKLFLNGVLQLLDKHQNGDDKAQLIFNDCHTIEDVETVVQRKGFSNYYQNFFKDKNTTQRLGEAAIRFIKDDPAPVELRNTKTAND